MEKVLVTGAGGCIGAWVVQQLHTAGAQPVVFDVSESKARLRLLFEDAQEADAVMWECGDIRDAAQVNAVVEKYAPAAVIHLAALQVPFCKARPAYGAEVNVVGTINVFEAVKAAGIKRLVYASSVAADAMEADNEWLETLYGAYKVCNEQCARVYWQEHGVGSTGIRPSVVYGAARDQGMSALPTLAMLAACAEKPYYVPFCGGVGFVYAAEAAAAFIQAVMQPCSGAAVFNLNGTMQTVEAVLEQIRERLPQAQLSCGGAPLPFPSELSDAPLRDYIGEYRQYTFAHGLDETLDLFKRRLRDERIDAAALLEKA